MEDTDYIDRSDIDEMMEQLGETVITPREGFLHLEDTDYIDRSDIDEMMEQLGETVITPREGFFTWRIQTTLTGAT